MSVVGAKGALMNGHAMRIRRLSDYRRDKVKSRRKCLIYRPVAVRMGLKKNDDKYKQE